MSHSLLSALRYARTDAKRNNNYSNLGKSSAGQFLLAPRNKKTGGAHVCTSVENLLLFASVQPRALTKANLTSNLWQVISKLIPILSCLCAGLRDTLHKKHATSPDSLAGYR